MSETNNAPCQRFDLRIRPPLSAAFPEPIELAATVVAPQAPTRGAPVIFCFPGGGYTRAYFDLNFPNKTGYSQAEYHAERGAIVIAMDYLGAGDSSLPIDAPPELAANSRFSAPLPLTLEIMAAACDAAVHVVLASLRAGTLTPALPPLETGSVIGIGQSVGGHIVVITQANHQTFDAIAALGSSFTQTRLPLRPGARYPARNAPSEAIFASLAQSDMKAGFHWPDEPADVLEADRVSSNPIWRSKAAPSCASLLMLPFIDAREAAAVRTPVFLGYGESDVTLEPLADVGMFRSSCDITLAIIPGMAHMHNFAETRENLWRRLHNFVSQVFCP